MNRKILFRIFLALLTYAAFVLLVINFYNDSPDQMYWDDREEYNRQFIAKVKLDEFTFEQALLKLGSPDITEARSFNDTYFQVMFYRTQHIKSDGITTQDECTFLLFIDGVLQEIGLGDNYPAQWAIINNYEV
jgi:hypothetical protein